MVAACAGDETLLTPSPIRVLVVDDSADLCDSVCAAAQRQPDIDCSATLTTRQLSQILDMWKPAIILMDLSIPGEWPLEVMRALRHSHPCTRIIAYTGRDDDEALDSVHEAGGWALIKKTTDHVAIFETVRRIAKA